MGCVHFRPRGAHRPTHVRIDDHDICGRKTGKVVARFPCRSRTAALRRLAHFNVRIRADCITMALGRFQPVKGTCGLTPEAPTQSPTVIAGLRRFAISLWLHFVASPQRVPAFGHRRRGRAVVYVIYRVPPPSWITTTSARSRGRELRRAFGCVAFCARNQIRTPMSCSRAPIHELTASDYAKPERVSSL
jgi:hypothetical protein